MVTLIKIVIYHIYQHKDFELCLTRFTIFPTSLRSTMLTTSRVYVILFVLFLLFLNCEYV